MCMYHFYNNNLKMERRRRRRCWRGVTQQLQAAGWPPCVRGDHRSLPWEPRTYVSSTAHAVFENIWRADRPSLFLLSPLSPPIGTSASAAHQPQRVGGVGGLTPSLGCCRDRDQGLPHADLFFKKSSLFSQSALPSALPKKIELSKNTLWRG